MVSRSAIAALCVNNYTEVKKPNSQEKWNAFHMREPTTKPMARFGENLKRLIEMQKISVARVAEGAHITPKQVYNLMAAGHDARIKGLEKVANVFGLSAWQMLAIEFIDKPALNSEILSLLELYLRTDEAGRSTIMRVAEIAADKPSR